MLAALAALTAHGASCVALQRGELRDLVVDARTAIERDDLELVGSVLTAIETRIPCLDHTPEPRIIADLYVVRAIAAFSRDDAWEPPLAAALRIRPAVDRIVGRAHPIYAWEPPTSGESVPLKTRREVYVDGTRATGIPSDAGTYLVQKTDGLDWNSRLIDGGTVSLGWATEPMERPRALEVWGQGSIGVGLDLSWQRLRVPDDRPVESAYQLDEGADWSNVQRPLAVILGEGSAMFYGPVGLKVGFSAAVGLGTPLVDAHALLALQAGRFRIGGGLEGFSQPYFYRISLFEADERELRAGSLIDVAAALETALEFGGRRQASVTLRGAARSPTVMRLATVMAYTFPSRVNPRVSTRIGLFGDVGSVDFNALGQDDLRLDGIHYQTGVSLGGQFRGRL